MRSCVRTILAAAAVSCALLATAVGDDASDAKERFRKEMDSVYDYLPFDVTQDVRDAKVKEMDRFWAFVAADLKTYRPLLRDALRDEKTNRYFLYDGSGLLVEHAEGPADFQLAADATARCRMKDVGRGYFWFCHTLAKKGANAVPAVLQMLDDPKYAVYVPTHSLKLGQRDCVQLCLLLMPEDLWVGPLVKRLAAEKDAAAATTLLLCLAQAVTPEADAAVRAIAADEKADAGVRAGAKSAAAFFTAPSLKGTPKRTHEEFAGWLAKADAKDRLPNDAMLPAQMLEAALLVEAADEPVLRSLRRKTARRVSDEAIAEIEFLTGLIRMAASKAK